MEQPHLWDEDAYVSEKRRAVVACQTQCPAIAACAQRLFELGDSAEGVWAGEILPKRPAGGAKSGTRLPDLPPSPITIISY